MKRSSRTYVGTCPRCGQGKVYRATEGRRTAHGIRDLPWWRCDNCGLTYQNSPNTGKVKRTW